MGISVTELMRIESAAETVVGCKMISRGGRARRDANE